MRVIDRIYLVRAGVFSQEQRGTMITQGYPFRSSGFCIRVRRATYLTKNGEHFEDQCSLSLISPPNSGLDLFDRSIPTDLAVAYISRSSLKLTKTRISLAAADVDWDIDIFHFANRGLVTAKPRSRNPGTSPVVQHRPPWLGADVTGDGRYRGDALAATPFTTWR